MYIKNSRKINETIEDYQNLRQVNNNIGIIFSGPVSNSEIVFESPAEVDMHADKFRSSMRASGVDYSVDEATIGAMMMSLLEESKNGLDVIPPFVLDAIIKKSRVFHKGELEKDPYLKNIHFEPQKCGNFELGMSSYRRYELTTYDSPASLLPGLMIPAFATFDHKFRFPNITENGSAWMSVTPNEIFTMAPHIKEAKGNVLALGCGMGYYAYMVSEKEDVQHVTVVERSPEVIELFSTYILPQFTHKEKITVICADAYSYMKELEDGKFDCCFAAIWKGNLDVAPYIKLKQLCKRFEKTKMLYWIEEAVTATLMSFVNVILMEEYCRNQDIPTPPVDLLDEEGKYIYEFLKDLFKDAEILTPEDVDRYMDPQYILSLFS